MQQVCDLTLEILPVELISACLSGMKPEDASSNPARNTEFFVVPCRVRLI